MNAETFRREVTEEFRLESDARKLHWQTTVVLGYCNTPLNLTEDGFDLESILGNRTLCGTSVQRLMLGGIKVIVWSPGLPYWKPSGESLSGKEKVSFIQQQLAKMHELPGLTDGMLQIARNAQDIRKINETGATAVLLHLSGVSHLNDLGILRDYYDLGVRMIHCGFQDWQGPDATGDAGGSERIQDLNYHSGRLNEHGVKTIEEMKKLGIIVDLAHIRSEGFDDIAPRLEGTPFVYSHGGCHALVEHWRNLEDERIARIAENHGVYGIGVYTSPPELGVDASLDPENARKHALIAEGRERRTRSLAASTPEILDFVRQRYSHRGWRSWEEWELARLQGYSLRGHRSQVVAHMKYLRDSFGPDVVGYGPDYEFTFGYVKGLEEADKTPSLTRALLEAGFTKAETQGAMGHNFMRVFEAVL